MLNYDFPTTSDNIPAAINGPTGTPFKKATPIIVPINNPVTSTGWLPMRLTPRPPSHATMIPATIATIIFQLSSWAISGKAIRPDTSGASTPIVRMIMPILIPY